MSKNAAGTNRNKLPTPEEALAIFIKRKNLRRAWMKANRERALEYQRAHMKKLRAGYAAAKKAGLVE